MRTRWLWFIPLVPLCLVFGCSHRNDALNDPIKPPGDAPYNNSAPEAKGALAAPGPPPGVPRPGGSKRMPSP